MNRAALEHILRAAAAIANQSRALRGSPLISAQSPRLVSSVLWRASRALARYAVAQRVQNSCSGPHNGLSARSRRVEARRRPSPRSRLRHGSGPRAHGRPSSAARTSRGAGAVRRPHRYGAAPACDGDFPRRLSSTTVPQPNRKSGFGTYTSLATGNCPPVSDGLHLVCFAQLRGGLSRAMRYPATPIMRPGVEHIPSAEM